MFTWFSKLKSQLVLLLGVGISILLLYISALKRAALRKEINLQKGKSNYKDRANEALSKGLENEAKKPKRGYFSKNP